MNAVTIFLFSSLRLWFRKSYVYAFEVIAYAVNKIILVHNNYLYVFACLERKGKIKTINKLYTKLSNYVLLWPLNSRLVFGHENAWYSNKVIVTTYLATLIST